MTKKDLQTMKDVVFFPDDMVMTPQGTITKIEYVKTNTDQPLYHVVGLMGGFKEKELVKIEQ